MDENLVIVICTVINSILTMTIIITHHIQYFLIYMWNLQTRLLKWGWGNIKHVFQFWQGNWWQHGPRKSGGQCWSFEQGLTWY